MTTKLDYCKVLFDKCKLLNSDEYYYTSFGPDYGFTIEKREDILVLKVWSQYYVFKGSPLKRDYIIKEPSDLAQFLIDYPAYYAKNEFSGKLIHMDNWIPMIEAFKLKKYSEEDCYKN